LDEDIDFNGHGKHPPATVCIADGVLLLASSSIRLTAISEIKGSGRSSGIRD
jgi:hypothetical protein